LEGVKTADVVVALFTDPFYPYRGTFTELGCALGLGKCVMAVCPAYCQYLEIGKDKPSYASNCFFHASRVVHCPSVDTVLPLLKV
jgi:nucleoside 2-deoxyribosyltransferase